MDWFTRMWKPFSTGPKAVTSTKQLSLKNLDERDNQLADTSWKGNVSDTHDSSLKNLDETDNHIADTSWNEKASDNHESVSSLKNLDERDNHLADTSWEGNASDNQESVSSLKNLDEINKHMADTSWNENASDTHNSNQNDDTYDGNSTTISDTSFCNSGPELVAEELTKGNADDSIAHVHTDDNIKSFGSSNKHIEPFSRDKSETMENDDDSHSSTNMADLSLNNKDSNTSVEETIETNGDENIGNISTRLRRRKTTTYFPKGRSFGESSTSKQTTGSSTAKKKKDVDDIKILEVFIPLVRWNIEAEEAAAAPLKASLTEDDMEILDVDRLDEIRDGTRSDTNTAEKESNEINANGEVLTRFSPSLRKDSNRSIRTVEMEKIFCSIKQYSVLSYLKPLTQQKRKECLNYFTPQVRSAYRKALTPLDRMDKKREKKKKIKHEADSSIIPDGNTAESEQGTPSTVPADHDTYGLDFIDDLVDEEDENKSHFIKPKVEDIDIDEHWQNNDSAIDTTNSTNTADGELNDDNISSRLRKRRTFDSDRGSLNDISFTAQAPKPRSKEKKRKIERNKVKEQATPSAAPLVDLDDTVCSDANSSMRDDCQDVKPTRRELDIELRCNNLEDCIWLHSDRLEPHQIDSHCFVCRLEKNAEDEAEELLRCDKYYKTKVAESRCNTRFHMSCLKEYNAGDYNVYYRRILEGNEKKGANVNICPLHHCDLCYFERKKNTAVLGEHIECKLCYRAFHEKCRPAGVNVDDEKFGNVNIKRTICHAHPTVPLKELIELSSKRVHVPFCCECVKADKRENLVPCVQCIRSFHKECRMMNTIKGSRYTDDEKLSLCESCIIAESIRVGLPVIVRYNTSFFPARMVALEKYPAHCASADNHGKYLRKPGFVPVQWAGCENLFNLVSAHAMLPMFTGSLEMFGKSKIDNDLKMAWEHMEKEIVEVPRPVFDFQESNHIEIPSAIYHRSCQKRSVMSQELDHAECRCSITDPKRCSTNDCPNRRDSQECPATCGDVCYNRDISNMKHNPLIVKFKTNGKGFGVKALEDIAKGSFIAEYAGEILGVQESQRRVALTTGSRNDEEMHYMMELDSERVIDCKEKGNIARFLNHSCDPNCSVHTVEIVVAAKDKMVKYDKRISILALRNIKQDEELCIDYRMEEYASGGPLPECKCGAENCTGKLGMTVEDREAQRLKKQANKEKRKSGSKSIGTASRKKIESPANRTVDDVMKRKASEESPANRTVDDVRKRKFAEESPTNRTAYYVAKRKASEESPANRTVDDVRKRTSTENPANRTIDYVRKRRAPESPANRTVDEAENKNKVVKETPPPKKIRPEDPEKEAENKKQTEKNVEQEAVQPGDGLQEESVDLQDTPIRKVSMDFRERTQLRANRQSFIYSFVEDYKGGKYLNPLNSSSRDPELTAERKNMFNEITLKTNDEFGSTLGVLTPEQTKKAFLNYNSKRNAMLNTPPQLEAFSEK